jgi:hypothetical protein
MAYFQRNAIVKIDPPYQGHRFLKFYAAIQDQQGRMYYHFGLPTSPDYIVANEGGHPIPIPTVHMIRQDEINFPRTYTLSSPAPGDVIGGKRRRKTQRRRRG